MDGTGRQKQVDKLVKNYGLYRDKLLQVTQKNRSVSLKKIYIKHNFDLSNLDKLKDGTVDKIVSKTIKNVNAVLTDRNGEGIRLNILLDTIDTDEGDSARAKLRTLSRNLVQIEEETGQQTGYLGFPFLCGHPNPDFYVRGPVILFPISLEQKRLAKSGGWFLRLVGQRPILNGALIAALKKKGQYHIPDNFEETFDELVENLPDEKALDPDGEFFEMVNEWIKTIIPINETNNVSQTTALEQLSRDDLNTMEEQPLHLVNHKIIGNFPQADNEIYRDYDELIAKAESLDVGVIGNLIDVEQPDGQAGNLDGREINIDAAGNDQLNLALASDSSQDAVILESKRSDLVVVRGPPGTGKSQVIVNLITDAMTNGEKVLVICQKRAALEVVRQRLGQVALDKYVVFLEKETDDRKRMYQRLHEIIETEAEPTHDSTVTLEQISGEIDRCVNELTELGAALKREHFGGVTAHKIYCMADGSYQTVLDLPGTGFELKWQELDRFVQKIQDVQHGFKKFQVHNHPWFGRKNLAESGIMEKNRLKGHLGRLVELLPRCVLAREQKEQSGLPELCRQYLDNHASMSENAGLLQGIKAILGRDVDGQYIIDNLQPVKKGTEFWGIFSRLRDTFDTDQQAHLLTMTADPKLLASYLQRLQQSLEDFEESWLSNGGLADLPDEDRHRIKGQLERLAELAPQCVLADMPDKQTELHRLFERYLNDTGFTGSKRRGITKQIQAILKRDADEQYIRENHLAVKNGVEFWDVFSDMLDAFGTEQQAKLRSMAADIKLLAPHIKKIQAQISEDTVWSGKKFLENVPQTGRLLERLAELAPQCVLAGTPDKQTELYDLFYKYLNDAGVMNLKRRGITKQIQAILGRDISGRFVQENIQSVKKGTEFWGMFSRLLDMLDMDRRDELTSMTDNTDTLALRLTEMRHSLEGFDSTWSGRTDHGRREDRGRLKDWLRRMIRDAPKCILASSSDKQANLQELFEKYLDVMPPLIQKNDALSKQIGAILGTTVSEPYIRDNLKAISDGAEFWGIFPELLDAFDADQQAGLRSMVGNPDTLKSRLDGMLSTLEDFDAMQEFDIKKNACSATTIKILNQMQQRVGMDTDWSEAIRQEIYAYWLAGIEQENPALKGEPVRNYERNRKNLAGLIKKKRDIVLRTIRQKIEGAIHPRAIYGSGSRYMTDYDPGWKEFSKELKKRRRVKPVRRLFEEHSSKMLTIAPCWLASPESVSKVFPLERNLFDVVIVDEASQLAVERAVPFLYRAKRTVIAGDEKQLPPFDLFQIREDEEDEDEEVSDEKSLLDLARTIYKTNNLSWHYRSEYQDLINFSNHAFYEGLLNVAPNAKNDPQHPPIRWIRCNGTWENRRNFVEAERVMDELKNIWEDSQARHEGYPSIGIIAFNESQQELIRDTIDKRTESDPEFGRLYALANEGKKKDERLFVKNIENVQGDERDVIIFSIGYARNASGEFANRFGTLNQKGGENRLNVAVTRARKKMVVISSIDHTDIKPTSTNEGPKKLKQFLKYAKVTDALDEKGQDELLSELNSNMKVEGQNRMQFDSEFEIQVYKKLKERGHDVRTQVGSSGYRIDLAIVHPEDKNRYVLGIECDGATFHSAKSVKERDIMRQEFLEGRGWVIERIWSRHWWNNPEHEIDRIGDRVSQEIKNPTAMRQSNE